MEARELLTALPPGFVETPLGVGLGAVTAMALAPDGRIFVAEQRGELRVVEDGRLLPAPFLTLDVDPSGERGLLGVALDPQFESNGFIYVYYTVPGAPAHNRVSRFRADGDVAAPGSEAPLIDLDPLGGTHHNGGAIHFGPDGKLYIATGDNESGPNSQSLQTTLGKILRIDPDGSIPADNPFVNSTTGDDRAIWALGLRNPYTFAFQPTTGRLFINDVGENTWEEIDDGRAGANYGWPAVEGPANDPRFQGPYYAYDHGQGEMNGCAVTGGAFYDPDHPQFPADWVGDYFFADFCGGWIRRIDPVTGQVNDFASGLNGNVVGLDVGPDGSLYYLSRGTAPGSSAIYRIQDPGDQRPSVAQAPASLAAELGRPATFSVAASGATPLGFQWMRDGVPIPGANSPSYTVPAVGPADLGSSYSVLVSNAFGSVVSQPATLDGDSPYVRALYFDILQTSPDAVTLNAAILGLAAGVSPSALATFLLLTPPARASAVLQAYIHVLGRAPSPTELAQGWNSLYVTQTPDDLYASLYASREYYLRQGGNARGFVNALYRDILGRAPNGSELAAARRNLGAIATRRNLARNVLGGDEAHGREVAGLYLTYLRRLPNPLEMVAWGQALRAGQTALQVQATVLGSREYMAIAPYIVALAADVGIRRSSRP